MYMCLCKLRVLYNELRDLQVIKTNRLIVQREINAVCSDSHKQNINTLCEQNVVLHSAV